MKLLRSLYTVSILLGFLSVVFALPIAHAGTGERIKHGIGNFFRGIKHTGQQVVDKVHYRIHRDHPHDNVYNNVYPDITIGTKRYVPAYFVRPGQIRIAYAGIEEKEKQALKNNYASIDDAGYITLKYDGGRSSIPDLNPLPVVLVHLNNRDQALLIDGHHDFMANQRLYSRSRSSGRNEATVYIEVKDDLRAEDPQEVWNILMAKNYIYPYSLKHAKVLPLPRSFDKLENDPYRFFVKMAMVECKGPDSSLQEAKLGVASLQYPLAVKWKDKRYNPYKGMNVPFIEFAVADMLYRHKDEVGFDYKAGDENDKTRFGELVEKARALLKKYPVAGFNFIPTKELAKKLMTEGPCSYVFNATIED